MRRFATTFVLVTGLLLSGCVSFAPSALVDAAAPEIRTSDAGASLASDRLIAADGMALPLRAWLPEGRPSAVILALHGLNDYSNAFALPAPELTAQGIAIYAY